MNEAVRDFLGSGWSFPIQVDQRGRIALASRETDVEQAIHMILLTPKGQRIMRPDFGCLIHTLVFEKNDGTTAGLAVHYVKDALSMWEPRINVIDVKAMRDRSDPARLRIEINYEIKATLDRRSLVFPFYTIPGEESPSSL